MFTGLQIYESISLQTRSYVQFYFLDKRWKIYNGKCIDIKCNPNRCKTLKQRHNELQKLERELYKKLSEGWTPIQESDKKDLNVISAFDYIQKSIVNGGYTLSYVHDLNDTSTQFQTFLKNEGLQSKNINEIKPEQIERFLERFTKSGTYFMNKRRFLSVSFSKLINLGYLLDNPVKKTSKRKVKARLHEAFSEEQLPLVFNYLSGFNSNLYLCALLMYGTLLRPHQEIRLLTRKNFSDDLTYILLDGYRNKNGKIRKTPTTDYVRELLCHLKIQEMKPCLNIFTGKEQALNKYYFNLMWGRAKIQMRKDGIINENQTLYSFRHTAAVNVFTKHQNLHLIQKMFAHSNMLVSLTYLRSIGQDEMVDESFMPKI